MTLLKSSNEIDEVIDKIVESEDVPYNIKKHLLKDLFRMYYRWILSESLTDFYCIPDWINTLKIHAEDNKNPFQAQELNCLLRGYFNMPE